MTAVTAARSTDTRENREFQFVVATGETIYQGTLCQLDSSGELVAAIVATGNVGAYIALATVVSAAAGALLEVKTNLAVKLENGNSLDASDIGSTAYAQDNATVHNTAATRSAIGQVVQVDTDGVWVFLQPQIAAGLTAANNLSDVANAVTSRANLVVNRLIVLREADLIGANADQVRYVHTGTDMVLEHIRTVATGALTTGAAVLTADIEGVAVTNGVVTIASGGAEDDVDVATPTAARTISEGEVLTITVSGAQDAAVFAGITIEGSY